VTPGDAAAVESVRASRTDCEVRPAGALGAFVECLWLGEPAETDGASFMIEPDGRVDVVLEFDALRGGALAFGTTTAATPHPIQRGRRYIGIRLRPTRSQRLIGWMPAALRNRHEPVTKLAGIDLQVLMEVANCATSPRHALQAVSVLLEGSIAGLDTRADLAAALVNHVEQCAGNVRVSELARQAALSERQLERIFNHAVGLSPKLYARIVRYRRVRAALVAGTRPCADLALRFGYTDQSHLLRDLRGFSGLGP